MMQALFALHEYCPGICPYVTRYNKGLQPLVSYCCESPTLDVLLRYWHKKVRRGRALQRFSVFGKRAFGFMDTNFDAL
jgi:hypothetical protein